MYRIALTIKIESINEIGKLKSAYFRGNSQKQSLASRALARTKKLRI